MCGGDGHSILFLYKAMKTFKPITYAQMHGYYATLPDGGRIEVVRCYAGEWSVFQQDKAGATKHEPDAPPDAPFHIAMRRAKARLATLAV